MPDGMPPALISSPPADREVGGCTVILASGDGFVFCLDLPTETGEMSGAMTAEPRVPMLFAKQAF